MSAERINFLQLGIGGVEYSKLDVAELSAQMQSIRVFERHAERFTQERWMSSLRPLCPPETISRSMVGGRDMGRPVENRHLNAELPFKLPRMRLATRQREGQSPFHCSQCAR